LSRKTRLLASGFAVVVSANVAVVLLC